MNVHPVKYSFLYSMSAIGAFFIVITVLVAVDIIDIAFKF